MIKIILSVLLVAIVIIAAVFLYFFISSLSIKLDNAKLTDEIVNLALYDKYDAKLANSEIFSNGDYIKSQDIPQIVKDSFVYVEDKRFYSHNGVDFYRIAGAVAENIKSMRFKEGASTITQQLIKNTHLSNEKSVTRKMAEIRLAMELEKNYPKDKILEMYLNSVYFGNNVYGIAKAAEYYFGKDVNSLTVAECATLAGMINAPNAYSPDKNIEKCTARRNLVLGVLRDNKIITQEQFEDAVCSPIVTSQMARKSPQKTYADMALTEACEILGVTKSQLKHSGFRIYTYLDVEKQKQMQSAVSGVKAYVESGKDAQKMGISVNNNSGGVEAFFSYTNENPYYLKRGVGSTAKPLVALAPAFEQDLASPATMILDEKTDFGGYKPSNINNNYGGWMTVREAITLSKNVPAVKLLNSLNQAEVKEYLQNLGYLSGGQSVNLRMALGGFDDGLSIKQLAEGYMMLADGGKYQKAAFIRKITDENGRILYNRESMQKTLLREDSAYLTTDILRDVITCGTAKNLGKINADVAGKTGTVGKSGCPNNSDALFCSYTPKDTTVFWVYSDYDDLLEKNISGSTLPVQMAKNYYNAIYTKNNSGAFAVPKSVVTLRLDKAEFEKNGKLLLANKFMKDNQTFTEVFSRRNRPIEFSDKNVPKIGENKQFERRNNFWSDFLDILKRPIWGALLSK